MRLALGVELGEGEVRIVLAGAAGKVLSRAAGAIGAARLAAQAAA